MDDRNSALLLQVLLSHEQQRLEMIDMLKRCLRPRRPAKPLPLIDGRWNRYHLTLLKEAVKGCASDHVVNMLTDAGVIDAQKQPNPDAVLAMVRLS